MGMMLVSGTAESQPCLPVGDIRFLGRQMIITYGQSRECDFTL